MTDQYAAWRRAVERGERIETERGNPRSGFYKQNAGDGRIEVIAIFRTEADKLVCIRTVYGDGSKLSDSEIDDLFGKVCLYPISEEAFRAVAERGEALPPEYGTRLTMKDQAAGIAWTPEYGRKRLGAEVVADTSAENPRAVIGDNGPPEEITPDKALAQEISGKSAGVKAWLAEIGGKPRNKLEADRLADYATEFGRLSKSVEEKRTQEKAPHLEADRAIDAKWSPVKQSADLGRRRCLEIAQEWIDAEQARRDAEAQAVAKSAGDSAPAQAEKVGPIGNVRSVASRSRTTWVITDARAYLAHLLAQDGDLPGEIVEAVGKVAQRRGEPAPGVEKQTIRSAA